LGLDVGGPVELEAHSSYCPTTFDIELQAAAHAGLNFLLFKFENFMKVKLMGFFG
jgi:hypothetical protein